MRKVWMAWVVVWAFGCMGEPPNSASREREGALAADGGRERDLDAGGSKPPLGHLPDASWCGRSTGSPHEDPWEPDVPSRANADGGAQGFPSGGGDMPGGDADAGSNVPAPAAQGELIITEIMVDPGTLRDTDGEWFELYNTTGHELDLHGCTLGDGVKERHDITEHAVLAAGDYMTVARTAAAGFVPDVVDSFSFTNTADQLVISCRGTIIDRVAFDRSQGFPLSAGASMALDPKVLGALDNDDPGVWCLSTASYGPELGTPGAENAVCFATDASVP